VQNSDLAVLEQHPSWAALKNVVAEKQDKFEYELVRALLHSKGMVDQRRLDYLRGFVEGMRWFLEQPGLAEKKLERQLRERRIEEVRSGR
jgi:hypothetical protein